MLQQNWIRWRRARCTVAAILLASLAADSKVRADAPHVVFDIGYMISCRDVTPDEFIPASPGERLIEASFQVSSLIHDGSEDDLIEYVYRIENPHSNVQVVDYLPKTTLTTDLAGNIDVEKKREDSKSLGVAVTGAFEHVVKTTPSADVRTSDSATIRYALLPPQDLLAASGTIRRGQGVYFKLKPSPRTSLEGGKQFVVMLRVPSSWRGDLVYVHCQARGYMRGVVSQLDEKRLSGAGDFVVALFAEGDEQAKAIAQQYVTAERELRRAAVDHHHEVRRQSLPSMAHRVGSLLSAVEPKIPTDWLDQLIFPSTRGPTNTFEHQLPPSIRTAGLNYRAAKRRLLLLNDQATSQFETSDQEY